MAPNQYLLAPEATWSEVGSLSCMVRPCHVPPAPTVIEQRQGACQVAEVRLLACSVAKSSWRPTWVPAENKAQERDRQKQSEAGCITYEGTARAGCCVASCSCASFQSACSGRFTAAMPVVVAVI